MTPTPSKDIAFETISAENIGALAPGLTRLHEQLRGESRSAEYWRWSLLESPAGGGSVAAVKNGRVVGKIGNIFLPMSINGQRAKAGLLEGFAVHDEARGWRCYQGLLHKCFEESVTGGILFGFAFSTRSATRMNRRIGWANLGRAPVYSGFINVAKALRGRRGGWALAAPAGRLAQPLIGLRGLHRQKKSDIEIRSTAQFGPEFDELWAENASRQNISVLKDAAYLSWRYLKCPDRGYKPFSAFRGGKLEGFIVVRGGGESAEGYILELIVRNAASEVAQALLVHGLNALAESGAGIVRASFPARSPEAAALRRIGFSPWATPFWGMQLVVASERDPADAPELAAANWNHSLGDWLYR
jgi:hypothetical protein